MGIATDYHNGSGGLSYSVGDAFVLFDRIDRHNAPLAGGIYAHGAGATGVDWLDPAYRACPDALAEADFPGLGGDFGGMQTWGNATSQTIQEAAMGLFVPSLPAILLGGSMGALTTLNTARDNGAAVAIILLLIPALDLADLHDNRGFDVVIDAAYGGHAGYVAAEPTRSPVNFEAAIAALDAPVHIWYSTDDAICIPAITEAYGTAVGATMHSLGAVGHSAFNVDTEELVEIVRAAL